MHLVFHGVYSPTLRGRIGYCKAGVTLCVGENPATPTNSRPNSKNEYYGNFLNFKSRFDFWFGHQFQLTFR